MSEPVRHTKDQFLRLFEQGEIQNEVAAHVAEMLENDPNKGEKRSWNNSYAFMDIVLRDDQIPANMEVICECDLDGCRADMVLLSPADISPKGRVAIVVELKQWDSYFPAELEQKRKAGWDVRDPSDPVAQTARYMTYFENQRAAEFDVSTVMGCVYLHNIKEEDYRMLYPTTTGEHEEVHVFFQGDTESFRRFVREACEGDALSPTYAIKRAKEAGYWVDGLPQTPGELRKRLLKLGLAQKIEGKKSQYEPTPQGAALGIRRFNGYDAQKEKPFVNCAFTDATMRKVAEAIAQAKS